MTTLQHDFTKCALFCFTVLLNIPWLLNRHYIYETMSEYTWKIKRLVFLRNCVMVPVQIHVLVGTFMWFLDSGFWRRDGIEGSGTPWSEWPPEHCLLHMQSVRCLKRKCRHFCEKGIARTMDWNTLNVSLIRVLRTGHGVFCLVEVEAYVQGCPQLGISFFVNWKYYF